MNCCCGDEIAGLVLRLVSPLLEFLKFTTETEGAIELEILRELLPELL